MGGGRGGGGGGGGGGGVGSGDSWHWMGCLLSLITHTHIRTRDSCHIVFVLCSRRTRVWGGVCRGVTLEESGESQRESLRARDTKDTNFRSYH